MLCRPIWKELYTYSVTAPAMRDFTVCECAKFSACLDRVEDGLQPLSGKLKESPYERR
jgi:hypothetical protein